MENKQCYICGDEFSPKWYIERYGHNVIDICAICAKKKGIE